MQSADSAAAAAAARQRKACIHCYQKKVRCDYSPELSSCTRCRQNGLDCTVQETLQKTSRSSIRSGFEGLSSRVRQLEDIVLLNPNAPVKASSTFVSAENVPTGLESDNGESTSFPVSSTKQSIVRSYRGTTSPWSTLVNHLESRPDPQYVDYFQENATRLANDERSSTLSGMAISLDLLYEFPHLEREDVIKLIDAYAIDAPYPILQYDSLIQITKQLLDTHCLTRWGQLVCILMYMSFGSTLVVITNSRGSQQEQAGEYLQRAWRILPQLLIDHDLWALKALTLMVHYLQASSKPETCWALLGTASRVAISLGFHQKGRKVDAYSPLEMEEGKRAWWLCYIMEKTFCTAFGYPSLTTGSKDLFNIDHPAPFAPVGQTLEDTEKMTAMPLGQNDVEAIVFFKDMIDLTYSRDEILSSKLDDYASGTSISVLLHSTLRDDQQGLFSPLTSPRQNLRSNISDLAHYNVIQVISMLISRSRGYTEPAPQEALLSARATLQLILETKSAGTTMCLWMWLYYAFTASVVLFVHTVTTPQHADDTILDLALLSDLQALCAPMATWSEGARRIRDIAGQMERVAFEVVKRAARNNKAGAKRTADEEGFADRTAEMGREKIPRTERSLPPEHRGGDDGGNLMGRGAAEAGSSAPRPGGDYGHETIGAEMLETAPQTFDWDQWDDWLEDVTFDFE